MPAPKRNPLQLLPGVLTPAERGQAVGLVVLMLFAAACEVIGIGAVFPLLNLLTHSQAMLANADVQRLVAWTRAETYERFVLLATIALLMLFILKNTFLSFVYYAQARFVCAAEVRIGTDLLAAYLHAPYVERVEQNSADRIRVITAEVGRLTVGFLLPLINIVAEALVIVALVALLIVVQPLSALLAIALVGSITAIVQFGFRAKLNAESRVRIDANSAMFRAVAESLGAIKETKVLHREQHFVRRFLDNSRRYASATIVFMTMSLLPRLFIETAAVAALAACIIVTIVNQRPLIETVPVLTIFGLAAARIMPSATRILGAVTNLRFHGPAVRDVAEHLGAARHVPHPAEQDRHAKVGHVTALELRRVRYRYPGADADALHDVTLRIGQGELVALVGRSGSGKTTLGDIVLGLIVPTAGEIRANDRPIMDAGRELGAFAGLVPQNFFILDDTIRRNVAFGAADAEIDDEKVWHALELARLAPRVRRDPLGLDARTGENGALLSGGERQRLSIARALYHDPGLLVLDEATSALDATTEAEIMETLRALAESKAILLITHRLASAEKCDRVIEIEDGVLQKQAPAAAAASARA